MISLDYYLVQLAALSVALLAGRMAGALIAGWILRRFRRRRSATM